MFERTPFRTRDETPQPPRRATARLSEKPENRLDRVTTIPSARPGSAGNLASFQRGGFYRLSCILNKASCYGGTPKENHGCPCKRRPGSEKSSNSSIGSTVEAGFNRTIGSFCRTKSSSAACRTVRQWPSRERRGRMILMTCFPGAACHETPQRTSRGHLRCVSTYFGTTFMV